MLKTPFTAAKPPEERDEVMNLRIRVHRTWKIMKFFQTSLIDAAGMSVCRYKGLVEKSRPPSADGETTSGSRSTFKLRRREFVQKPSLAVAEGECRADQGARSNDVQVPSGLHVLLHVGERRHQTAHEKDLGRFVILLHEALLIPLAVLGENLEDLLHAHVLVDDLLHKTLQNSALGEDQEDHHSDGKTMPCSLHHPGTHLVAPGRRTRQM